MHHAIIGFSVRRILRRVFLATCLYESSVVVRLQRSVVGSLHAAKKHIRWSCNISIKIYESYISSCSLRVIKCVETVAGRTGDVAWLSLAAVAGVMLVVFTNS